MKHFASRYYIIIVAVDLRHDLKILLIQSRNRVVVEVDIRW